MASIKIGTCSWNYDSWLDLVYSEKSPTAAGYLAEYSKHYTTAEIDSWFYKIPATSEVHGYLEHAGSDLRFTCKVPREITLTHQRNSTRSGSLVPNEQFLSHERFSLFLEAVREMLPRIDALMFEFEYLNREKMDSLNSFLERLDAFFTGIDPGLPVAIETRNKNYLTRDYFSFLNERAIIPVFSEKQYMPPVREVYEAFSGLIDTGIVVRLLGGDRKTIEQKTGQNWNRIVEEKPAIDSIARMARSHLARGLDVTINVNNHYEGSAPLTIEKLRQFV